MDHRIDLAKKLHEDLKGKGELSLVDAFKMCYNRLKKELQIDNIGFVVNKLYEKYY